MKHYLRLLFIVVILANSTPLAYAKEAVGLPHASQTSHQEKAKQEIQDTFDAWLAAVSSGSADAVLKLYAPEAILLPTLSPKVADTQELRKAYFDVFTAKTDLKGTVNEEHIRIFGNIAINSGLYTFTYKKDGEKVVVPARFSFVYHKTPEGWLIVDHHSSRMPEMH